MDRVNLDSDDETKKDDDDEVQIVERNEVSHPLDRKGDGDGDRGGMTKIEPKEETFLMVEESEIGVYRHHKKKKKLYAEERVIRMENDNGLVVTINNSTRFKAKQAVIREPKVFKSPFEWYHARHLKEWIGRCPEDNSIQMTIKMKKHWDREMLESEKAVYTELSKKDKTRYQKELEFWKNIEWMKQRQYD